MKIQYDGFQWDSGNIGHCVKHGVSRDEIEYVLSHMSFVIPDPNPDESRMRTAGKTDKGRYVFVVFTFREIKNNRYIRPISARYMHQREVRAYEQFKET